MKNTMQSVRSLLLAGMVMAGLVSANAQPSGPGPGAGPGPGESTRFVFLEPLTLSSADSGRVRVDVLFRIDRFFFVSVRNTEPGSPWAFRRMGEILIELIDSVGGSTARRLERIETTDNQAEPSPTERSWVTGVSSFDVPPGTYSVFFEATDIESKRRLVNKETVVRASPHGAGRMEITDVLLVIPPALSPPDTLIPDSYAGDLLFSSRRGLWVEMYGVDTSLASLPVRWSITTEKRQDRAFSPVAVESTLSVPLIRGRRMVPVPETGVYTFRGDSSARSVYAYFPLASVQLPLRSYLFQATFGSGADTASITRTFRTIWPDMPLSLKNIDFAMDMLRFITTEDQLDSLKSGDFEERIESLERFWSTKDRTPGTAMNEVMAEYYRRVDHAIRTFATLREPDGTKSDRGRTYILYGPPTRTDRTLNPGRGFTEVWTYDRLRRTFTFEDEARNGTYKLVSSTPL
jgi:GWxTD domain-containing protein